VRDPYLFFIEGHGGSGWKRDPFARELSAVPPYAFSGMRVPSVNTHHSRQVDKAVPRSYDQFFAGFASPIRSRDRCLCAELIQADRSPHRYVSQLTISACWLHGIRDCFNATSKLKVPALIGRICARQQ